MHRMISKLKRRRFEGCTLKQAAGCFNVRISIDFHTIFWLTGPNSHFFSTGSLVVKDLVMTELLAFHGTDDSGYGKPFRGA